MNIVVEKLKIYFTFSSKNLIENLLTPFLKLCEKLKKFAEFAHLKSGEVVKAIREAVIEHATNAQDIYKKAVDFLTQEITCEKVLKPEVRISCGSIWLHKTHNFKGLIL